MQPMFVRSTSAALLLLGAIAATGVLAEEMVDELIEIPPPKEEIITVRPSLEEVWIPGSWERAPGKWSWVDGHWQKPPHQKARWRPGHWMWTDGKWRWNKGHWAVADRDWIVEEIIDAPGAYPETQPSKPSATNHWVAGHWDWDGGWYWVPGYYTTKPDPKAVWVPGQWEPYGTHGYWWMGGHWRVE